MKKSPYQNPPPQKLDRLLRNGERLNREERVAVQEFIDDLIGTQRYQVMESSIAMGQGGLRIQTVRVWRGLDEWTTRLYRRLHIIGAEEPQPKNDGGRRWWNILARLLVVLIALPFWGPVVAGVESGRVALTWRPIARARHVVAAGFWWAVTGLGQILDQSVIRSRRRLYLRSGKAYRQLLGLTGLLLIVVYMVLQSRAEFAVLPLVERPSWGVWYGLSGLVYLGLWAALVVDTWREFAPAGIRRRAAQVGRVWQAAARVLVWPIRLDLDHAVRQDGFDPTSPEGRLHRLAIVRRVLVWGTALNIACAVSTPIAIPLLVLHPVLWVVFVSKTRQEQLHLMVEMA